MNSTAKHPSQKSIIPAIIIAGLFWAIYTFYVDDFFSSQLRLISSYLAEQLLTLININCHRNGTVLYGSGMRFEVIGACSGSTILKIMLGAGIFLALSWNNLRVLYRLLMIILSALLAISGNAIRVCLLVILSIDKGFPITEGILHESIGLITFIFTFLTFCFLCYLLNTQKASPNNTKAVITKVTANHNSSAYLLLLILPLLFLPFLQDLLTDWLGSSWNQNNQLGWIFFFFPLILTAYRSYRYRTIILHNRLSLKISKIRIIQSVIIFSLFLPVISILIDVKIFGGIGMLLLLAAIIFYYTDRRNLILMTPLIMIASLGFPRTPLRLENIFQTFSVSISANIDLIRFILLLTVLTIQLLLSKKMLPPPPYPAVKNRRFNLSRFTLYSSIIALTITFILTATFTYQYRPENQINKNSLNLPYLIANHWLGSERRINRTDIAYFGAENIIHRDYSPIKSINKTSPVELLITFSGGDRHKIHPPEFCQSGSGWRITSKKEIGITTINGDIHKAMLLQLRKNKEAKYMLYWFTTENNDTETNFSKMMLKDITSRLTGHTPNWIVTRLFSKSSSALLSFARRLPTLIPFPHNT